MSLMLQCGKARHNELSEGEMTALAEECKGMHSIPIFGREISMHADQQNWSMLRGALAPLLQIESGDRVSVTQNTTATVSVDISQAVQVIQALPNSALSDSDKDTLAGMLATLQALEGDAKNQSLWR